MPRLHSNIPAQPGQFEPLRAVIFDWAGTTVDFGSLAPLRTLERVFSSFNIAIQEEEARRDMGIAKRDHIAKLLHSSRIRAAWAKEHGAEPSDADVEVIYQRFLPLQLSCLAEYSTVIPGVPEIVDYLRARGLKIGSNTGYTRAMLDVLLENSATQGYRPDCALSPEDVGAGRPAPFMLYQAAIRLRVYPLAAMVKVGDTISDIEEDLNAGTWSVGVAATGNMIGLTQTQLQRLPPSERSMRLRQARQTLTDAGAHYVIDTVAELPGVLDDIERQLR